MKALMTLFALLVFAASINHAQAQEAIPLSTKALKAHKDVLESQEKLEVANAEADARLNELISAALGRPDPANEKLLVAWGEAEANEDFAFEQNVKSMGRLLLETLPEATGPGILARQARQTYIEWHAKAAQWLAEFNYSKKQLARVAAWAKAAEDIELNAKKPAQGDNK